MKPNNVKPREEREPRSVQERKAIHAAEAPAAVAEYKAKEDARMAQLARLKAARLRQS